MTTLRKRAFAEAAKRWEAEQDLLASRMLAEIEAEVDFDRAIAHQQTSSNAWRMRL